MLSQLYIKLSPYFIYTSINSLNIFFTEHTINVAHKSHTYRLPRLIEEQFICSQLEIINRSRRVRGMWLISLVFELSINFVIRLFITARKYLSSRRAFILGENHFRAVKYLLFVGENWKTFKTFSLRMIAKFY